MTEQDKSEHKLKPGAGSETKGSHGDESPSGDSAIKNDAARQQAPAGVQSVETENPFLNNASRPEQHEHLRKNVQPEDGRPPQAQPTEAETPAGLPATDTKVEKKGR